MTRRQEVLIVSLTIAALLALVGNIWRMTGPFAFAGGDGKTFQTLVLNYLEYAAPLEVNTFNPLQGLFSQQLPLNTWLHPGYLPFRLLEFGPALIASASISLLALVLATYGLGRCFGLPPGTSLVGASAAVFTQAPFIEAAGFFSLYVLVPPYAFSMALMTIAPCALTLLTRASIPAIAANGGLVALLLALALYLDPLFFNVGTIGLAVLWACAVFRDGLRLARARAMALAIAALLLYLAGAFDFVLNNAGYTARMHFAPELARPQVPGYASVIFAYPERATLTFALVAIGAAALALLGSGAQRFLAWAALAQLLLLAAIGCLFLFAPFQWTLPLPLYFEQAYYHVFMLTGIAGFASLLRKRWPRFAALDPRRGAVLGACIVIGWLLVYRVELAPGARGMNDERWADDAALVGFLSERIALPAGREFNGSVAALDATTYDDIQTLVNLWKHRIPSLNEYSQLHTPAYRYFTTRLFGYPPTASYAINQATLSTLDARILGLLGARYAYSHRPTLEGAALVGDYAGRTVGDQPSSVRLFEIAQPNLGDYSPTEIFVARDAAATLEKIRQPRFNVRTQAVLEAEPPAHLVRAHNASLRYEAGKGIRVRATSDGPSLLLLPVQYSRCLEIESSDKASLVRADFLLTGLYFEQRVDALLKFGFGYFHAACRAADRRDMTALGVAPAGGALDRQLIHPYLPSSAADLPARALAVMRAWNAGRKSACAHQVDGRLNRWLKERGLPRFKYRLCAPASP